MAGEVMTCKLCRRDISKSRWMQHIQSKLHCALAEESERELKDIEDMCCEEGVLDDTSGDDDTSSEDLSE